MPPRPKLPKIGFPNNPLQPVRKVLSEGHRHISQAREDIRSVADDLHGFSILGHPTAAPPRTEKSSGYGVTDEETLLYQLDHLFSILKQLEIHLSEGCRIMGKPCDCCGKHAMEARIYAMETISIAARMGKETSIYQDISDWAPGIEAIDTPEKVESGEYDETYRKESGTASKFRKKIQSMIAELKEECPGCDELRETIGHFIEERKRERGGEGWQS